MANVIKVKQSATPGKVPTTAQLALGELAVNTYDGKLYLKKNVAGTESIVDVSSTATSGTVTSVSGTGTVSGLTLSGTVTSTGNLTLGGTLAVTPSNFASQTANYVLAAPNGAAGTPTFRALVAADIPTLNQNTTGTAANVTGTVAIANGGTGATSASAALTNLGALPTSGGTVTGNLTVNGEFFAGAPAFGGFPLAPNLIHNSYMRRVTSGVPDGFSTLGNITIQAVHPFTQAFEGPYTPSAPTGSVSNPNLATESTPYWFGTYVKGPRIARGGMGDGWHSYNDGKILKVTGSGITSDYTGNAHCSIFLPKELNNLGANWFFSSFVKIVKGSVFCVGSDAGYIGINTGNGVTKAQTDAGPQGWIRYSALFGTSQITSIDGLAISMAVLPDANGDIEAYIALPYLANVAYKGTNADSWSGSVVDKLDRMGFYINPNSAGDVRINENQVIHAGNYNSYAPTKTGGGASGTWGINVTGTAANVTGTVAIANGGTGATTAAAALTNLGAYPASNPNGYTSNAGTVTSVGGTGTVSGLTLTGTVTGSGNLTLGGTLSASIDNITDEHRLFNNMGDNHGTRTTFDAQGAAASVNFGWRYVQGATNGPGIASATQYYSALVGLGNDYQYNQYGMQIAIPRTPLGGSPYLSVRFEENGVFRAWSKIYAGYADTAGSAPASDVYAWAKAAAKPSYTYSEVGAPSATGTGASGSWAISVTGSSASCTGNAATATTASNLANFTAAYSGNASNVDAPTTLDVVGYCVQAGLPFGQGDGALYSAAYSTSWYHQIFGDFRSGQIAIRGKNNGVWQGWRTVLDSSNYNSYAPTLTGTGASGSWPISVTGSSASCTGNAANVTGTVAIANGGTGATSQQAAINALAGAVTSAKFLRGDGTNVTMSAIQASDVPTLNQNTTGTAAGLSGSQTANYVYAAPNGTAGTASFRALVAADIPTLNQNTTGTAANVTGTVAIANGGTGATTAAAARTNLGLTAVATTAFVSGGAAGVMQVGSDGVVEAGRYLDFHAAGGDAVDYTVRLDGGAAGSTTLSLTGSLTASGNVTAYSDERLKTDWADLPADIVDQLADVKHGAYTRTDSGIRQIGVSAQSLQQVMPEAVLEDGNGMLSVAYGNAALAACVALAKEVVALRAEVEALKAGK